jgi:hypothetical protein
MRVDVHALYYHSTHVDRVARNGADTCPAGLHQALLLSLISGLDCRRGAAKRLPDSGG